MIACIEPAAEVVWGIGQTAEQARADAKIEIAKKPHFSVGELQFAKLSNGADLDADGGELWHWVEQVAMPIQDQLF